MINKYSLILFSLGIVSFLSSLLLIGQGQASQWLFGLGLLLLIGQIVLFFLLNRQWISSAIVAAYIAIISYFYFATFNHTVFIFSWNYLWYLTLYLPLLIILLIYLIQRGPIFVNLKRNASAVVSVLNVNFIHFFIVFITATVNV